MIDDLIMSPLLGTIQLTLWIGVLNAQKVSAPFPLMFHPNTGFAPAIIHRSPAIPCFSRMEPNPSAPP